MAEMLYNSLVSYIAQVGGLNATDVTFQLVDTALFPDTGDYRVVVDQEIMLVSSHSAGVLSVTRGQEGTTATSHSNQTAVFLVWTAGGMEAWKSS